MMTRQLKIIAWNARGVREKRNELHFFLSDLDIDVALISETKLTLHDTFRIPSYAVYRTDRPARPHGRNPGGGTAVLVHRRLVHRPCKTATGSLETTGVIINVGREELLLAAAYHPPGGRLDRKTLNAFLTNHVPFILAGDFNAKHPAWESRVANNRGNALKNYLELRGGITVIATPEPTFIPTNQRHRPDVLDIALSKDLVFPVTASVVNDLSSDHLPVLLTVDASPAARLPPATTAVKTDWEKFH
jgi:endonuclease/exonuclease/phosphatase (EEP) superfamily protein YafD